MCGLGALQVFSAPITCFCISNGHFVFFADGKNVEVVKMVEEKTRIFQCSGDDVHWYYNDTLVEDSKVDSNQPNTLILSSVTLGDAGTYVCKNARNSVIKTVEVQVTLSKN